MARKITLFELHFDDSRFGLDRFGLGERTDAPAEASRDAWETGAEQGDYPDLDPAETPRRRSRMRRALLGVGAVAAVVVARRALRRFRGGDGEQVEIDRYADEDAAEPSVQ